MYIFILLFREYYFNILIFRYIYRSTKIYINFIIYEDKRNT